MTPLDDFAYLVNHVLLGEEPTIEDFILLVGTIVAFIAFILWCCFPIHPKIKENDYELLVKHKTSCILCFLVLSYYNNNDYACSKHDSLGFMPRNPILFFRMIDSNPTFYHRPNSAHENNSHQQFSCKSIQHSFSAPSHNNNYSKSGSASSTSTSSNYVLKSEHSYHCCT